MKATDADPETYRRALDACVTALTIAATKGMEVKHGGTDYQVFTADHGLIKAAKDALESCAGLGVLTRQGPTS